MALSHDGTIERLVTGALSEAGAEAGAAALQALTIDTELLADRKSTRLNSSHIQKSRMPSSA